MMTTKCDDSQTMTVLDLRISPTNELELKAIDEH